MTDADLLTNAECLRRQLAETIARHSNIWDVWPDKRWKNHMVDSALPAVGVLLEQYTITPRDQGETTRDMHEAPPLREHQFDRVLAPPEHGFGWFWGVCRCGWRSPAKTSNLQAEAAVVEHSASGVPAPEPPPRTLDELQALLPDAAIETVGEREELVIYTGLSEIDGVLVEMVEEGE